MNDQHDFLTKLFEAGFGYIWLMMIAIWGGTVNYLSRIKQGKVGAFSFIELVGEWTISGFAGLLSAFICIESSLSWEMTAFFTGVSGHLGGRAIALFEEYAKQKFPVINKVVKEAKGDLNNDDV